MGVWESDSGSETSGTRLPVTSICSIPEQRGKSVAVAEVRLSAHSCPCAVDMVKPNSDHRHEFYPHRGCFEFAVGEDTSLTTSEEREFSGTHVNGPIVVD